MKNLTVKQYIETHLALTTDEKLFSDSITNNLIALGVAEEIEGEKGD